MNIDETWRGLARTDALPAEAIEASLENWDAVSDRYLAKLRAHASGVQMSVEDENALFIVLHMFAEKGDKRALAPLRRELIDNEEINEWLGDALTDTLVKVLINLYDDEPESLQEIFAADAAFAEVRQAALQALAYLTRARHAMTDEAMRAYLRQLGQTLTDAEDPLIGAAWAQAVAALGYDDLGPDVARAISKGVVDADFYDIKDFHADLRVARDDPAGLALFAREGVEPFGSTIEALSEWEWGDPSDDLGFDPGDGMEFDPDEEFAAEPPPLEMPVVNPLRHVGRNDPCPCGSGKKYKKCCLAQNS
jgi:uncharacterized protein